MPNLSNRLNTIFQLIPKGSKVADIGTDHAHLPIALCLSGKTKNIIACDIKEKPLLIARKNLDKSGCSFVQTRLGDGLSPIKSGEADCVVIAGMGGEVIVNILNASPISKENSVLFLLQPMTHAPDLRKWLCSNGFTYSEIAVFDKDKIYTVFSATKNGIKRDISPREYFIGDLTGKTQEEKLYINKQLSLIKNCIDGLKNVESKKEQYLFYLDGYNSINSFLENN